jgi:hypothetical protein
MAFPETLNEAIFWLRDSFIADTDRLARVLEHHSRDQQHSAQDRGAFARLSSMLRDMHQAAVTDLKKLPAVV